ncbi:Beta-galactosidase [Leucobacter sp. BZR 635]
MSTFSIGETDFLRDGTPHRIIAGALHYFRVHPEQWQDRIRKARLMGLNTIETYVAWNAHEPRRGEWDATGWNDLGRFLDLVAAEGMDAIVRPGPYICAEWHNGGLPIWVDADERTLRSSDPAYLADVTEYLERVYEIVAPRQTHLGGSVVLVQIENEYGAYGSDKAYLEELVRVTRAAGIDVPLTTVDQPMDDMLADGSLDTLHRTGSFGGRVTERLARLREHQPTGPLMCSEFWDGWFDWWGGVHHTTDVDTVAASLDELLATGASVNIYMFHGGTNFGLTNGANHKGRYLPLTTSYDYDAPLDEAGNPTAKYFAMRDVIAKYAPVPAELPEADDPLPELTVPLRAAGRWIGDPAAARPAEQALPASEAHPTFDEPPTFDELGHLGALVRYDAALPEGFAGGVFSVEQEIRDLAWVSVDGQRVGRLARTSHERALTLPAGRTLSVLVEEQGRVNYGHRLGEEKGIIGTPLLNGEPLTGWRATPLDVEAIAAGVAELRDAGALGSGSEGAAADPERAVLERALPERAVTERAVPGTAPDATAWLGDFELDAPSNLVLDTSGWGKGYAFVNGFFLGRYWRNGPGNTMFVPGPATHAGRNTIVVLELEHLLDPLARFVSELSLGDTEE